MRSTQVQPALAKQPSDSSAGNHLPDTEMPLESVPAKSPHRKYLVLLALHMMHTDDPRVLSAATDCSERTFHYVKSRLCKHDGVIINYDRAAGRYAIIHSGVLDLPRVAELIERHYPQRYANIKRLAAALQRRHA